MKSGTSQKQGMDIYTVLLLIAMICMLIAVIAMYIERNRYAPDFSNTNAALSAVEVILPQHLA